MYIDMRIVGNAAGINFSTLTVFCTINNLKQVEFIYLNMYVENFLYVKMCL